jgi:1,2-phenylacetyl-CoA epoxidase catalytic subunit
MVKEILATQENSREKSPSSWGIRKNQNARLREQYPRTWKTHEPPLEGYAKSRK